MPFEANESNNTERKGEVEIPKIQEDFFVFRWVKEKREKEAKRGSSGRVYTSFAALRFGAPFFCLFSICLLIFVPASLSYIFLFLVSQEHFFFPILKFKIGSSNFPYFFIMKFTFYIRRTYTMKVFYLFEN